MTRDELIEMVARTAEQQTPGRHNAQSLRYEIVRTIRAIEAAGMRIVGREPTHEMDDAIYEAVRIFVGLIGEVHGPVVEIQSDVGKYACRAMFDAAPKFGDAP